ncbi:acireductone dioxygenase [Culicoides brevitarsis]|uniref:acireductone dioxygenase n=1 Tax=Culicoides brevitarsis TaxID=469753 RepID=UPI00307C91B6
MRAWYMDELLTDQREPHMTIPPQFLDENQLFERTGVEYFSINANAFADDAKLQALRKSRGYSYEDEITCSKECLADYEEKLKSFFTEHLHTDEEIRLVLDGSGYFDVRSDKEDDKWIRIEVVAGDLIVIPSGIYHRFTLDMKNYIKAKRYFVGEPVWLPYNRPADDMSCRKIYLKKLSDGFKSG